MNDDEKNVILKILAGWRLDKTVRKRVRAKISSMSKRTGLGKILYAVFGHHILTYVEFRLLKNGHLQVGLDPAYNYTNGFEILINVK